MTEINITRRGFIGTAALAVVVPSTLALEGCSTTWISVLNQDLPTIISIAESVLQLIGTATGNGAISAAAQPAVDLIVKAIEAGLTTLQQIITDYNAHPSAPLEQNIYQVLTDVLNNLSNLLPAAGIKNTALQTTISSVVAIILTVLQSIKLIMPPSAAPVALRLGHAKAQASLLKVKVLPRISDAKSLAEAILAGAHQ